MQRLTLQNRRYKTVSSCLQSLINNNARNRADPSDEMSLSFCSRKIENPFSRPHPTMKRQLFLINTDRNCTKQQKNKAYFTFTQ